MANALYIVKLMLTARRPSHTLDMRSVSIPFWLRGNYDAMTFFGSIVTHSQAEALEDLAGSEVCDIAGISPAGIR